MKNIKYAPTLIFAIAYFILLVTVFILFMGRTNTFLRFNSLSDYFPDFYQHISNFSISYLLYSGFGLMWLLLGIPFKLITIAGVIIACINFIYELWIGILNTPDVIDAYYGFWGTLLAFLFLLATKIVGLQKLTKKLD